MKVIITDILGTDYIYKDVIAIKEIDNSTLIETLNDKFYIPRYSISNMKIIVTIDSYVNLEK